MHSGKLLRDVLRRWVRLFLVLILLQAGAGWAALEQTFDVLQVGTTTYQNVTVTTRDKNYVFILHSKGMTNLKVADLSPELRIKLGYTVPVAAQPKTNSPAVWARQTISKINVPQVKTLETQLAGLASRIEPLSKLNEINLSRNSLLLVLAGIFALYLLHCYCCLLICRKAGAEPNPLIWVPVLQLFPLLKAAAMSPWWFLGFIIPGVNVLAQILWSIRITEARNKTLFVALLLIFPLSSPFAALYLAFSGGAKSRNQDRRVEIMTLEAA